MLRRSDVARLCLSCKDPAHEIRAVEDTVQFERIAAWPGLDEPGNTHVLWRMMSPAVPGGVAAKGR